MEPNPDILTIIKKVPITLKTLLLTIAVMTTMSMPVSAMETQTSSKDGIDPNNPRQTDPDLPSQIPLGMAEEHLGVNPNVPGYSSWNYWTGEAGGGFKPTRLGAMTDSGELCVEFGHNNLTVIMAKNGPKLTYNNTANRKSPRLTAPSSHKGQECR